MTYEPTIWECGDVVTAERLNHMEEGIEAANACCEGGGGSEPLVVGMTIEEDTPSAGQITYTLDKTWQEIDDAFPNVYLLTEEDNSIIDKKSITETHADSSEPLYAVEVSGSARSYETDSPSGYPSFIGGGAG